ncbi:MAG: hypothetical protein GTO02_19730 [Candidatus Dadabacteria bacterium]|nr:hypothetical protein [Candidatus Dadabacteria bacterium]NIQ16537.1 hypothetical protein [Candidatus Dadabacteria bacterium]
MLTFTEEILLLMLDDDSGKVEHADPLAIKYALGGSILMELAVKSKIEVDSENLKVIENTPTGIDILDKYLTAIDQEKDHKNTSYWINYLSLCSDDIQKHALNSLIEKGILKEVEEKILWVFDTRRYPLIDEKEEKEVKKRIVDLLYSDEIPTPRDVVLISLADTCNILPSILSQEEVEHASDRIAEIKEMDVIGQVISKVVRQLHLDIAQAMTMMH